MATAAARPTAIGECLYAPEPDRKNHTPTLPVLLRGLCKLKAGVKTTGVAPHASSIKKCFPKTYGGPVLSFQPNDTSLTVGRRLNVGVVLCGGPAPGIVSLFCGLHDYLLKWNKTSKLYGFVGGPQGLVDCNARHVDANVLHNMLLGNGIDEFGTGRMKIQDCQKAVCKATCEKLDLGGLLFVGGFETNTDAAWLAEYFEQEKVKTRVIATSKRAEGLRSQGVEVSFGFDSVTKVYSQLVGNICTDVASAKQAYHFIRLMGETASHITLEVAMLSHPNFSFIGEEILAKGYTIKELVDQVADMVEERAKHGKNYGVVLIPEGIIHFISEMETLIEHLNKLFETATPIDKMAAELPAISRGVFESLPDWLREQFLNDRDQHGRVKLASVQVERFFAQMVDKELKRRKEEGTYIGKFGFACHFYGYEARMSNPSQFDASLAYSLGHVVCILMDQGYTSYLATVGNLTAPVDDWTCGGIPITSQMCTQMVSGKPMPVVRRSTIDLEGYTFTAFAGLRQKWAVEDWYRKPAGTVGNDRNVTCQLEALEKIHRSSTCNLLDHEKKAELRELVQELVLDQSTFIRKRLLHEPEVPPVIRGGFKFVENPTPGEQVATAEEAKTLQTLFSNLYQVTTQRILLTHLDGDEGIQLGKCLNVGIVLSGGPAPGGHNVIAGLYDFLKGRCINSRLFGFRDGPAGLIACDYIEITAEMLAPFRNQGGFNLIGTSRVKIETPAQMRSSADACVALGLHGLIVCGGDDSNTNAALLADYFLKNRVETCVVGTPKTIDADLRNDDIEMSFGFDTTTKLYSQLIANIAFDSSASSSTYHFIRLMGRSASHICLEAALQTHPNYAAISEEVEAKKQTIVEIVRDITDMVVKRAEKGKNFGIILLPEGLIEFTVDMSLLIKEINELLAKNITETDLHNHLTDGSKLVYNFLPEWLRLQLMAERDPHGNVRVSMIESERLVGALVEAELKKRPEYTMHFRYWASFMGYQGRCGLVSNFDCNYCYTLGHLVGALVNENKTGYIAAIKGLASHPSEWILGAVPLPSLMNIERRHGKDNPVIKKKLVELDSRPFQMFAANRELWALEDSYPKREEVHARFAPTSDQCNMTLMIEFPAPACESPSRFSPTM